jgi:hypothetical protein
MTKNEQKETRQSGIDRRDFLITADCVKSGSLRSVMAPSNARVPVGARQI